MCEKATVYIVSNRGKQGPRLIAVSAECKKKVVKLDKRISAFGYASVIPIGSAHFTPEAALNAWHEQCEQAVRNRQAELDAAIALRDVEVQGVNRR